MFRFLNLCRVAWWLLFISRQCVTFELARLTQWLVIDVVLAFRPRRATDGRIAYSSIFTFFFLQSKGWPFWLQAWGIWDLLILRGDDPYQHHWLYWTGIELFTKTRSGVYILTSKLYMRILFSMIAAGFATAVKRTIVDIRFGRRQLGKSPVALSCVFVL